VGTASHLKNSCGIKQKAGPRKLAVAEAGPRLAIFVYGLKNSISSSAPYHPLLAVINYKRENFREQIPGPLVLWVPEYVLQASIEGAPDFWAWRSGVFEFAAPQLELEKSLTLAPERRHVELSRMLAEEKRHRLQLFSSLLAEYESRADTETHETMVVRGDLLNRLGMLYYFLGELEKALEYLEKSLAIKREIEDRAGMIPTLHNMAHICLQNQQLKAALQAFGEALQLSHETKNAEGLFNVSRDLGTLLCQAGQKEQGPTLLRQALEVGQQMGHPNVAQVEELLRQYS
jgi:tetratricopeptide (TPR) repeat protein